MWILAAQPGFEPAPPALEGKVPTTGPPGKSRKVPELRLFRGRWGQALQGQQKHLSGDCAVCPVALGQDFSKCVP